MKHFIYWMLCANGCPANHQSFITNPNQKEVICSNCNKVTQVNTSAATNAYIKHLEQSLTEQVKKNEILVSRLSEDHTRNYFVKLKSGGSRLFSKKLGDLYGQLNHAL